MASGREVAHGRRDGLRRRGSSWEERGSTVYLQYCDRATQSLREFSPGMAAEVQQIHIKNNKNLKKCH
jgi:hypothetical protein